MAGLSKADDHRIVVVENCRSRSVCAFGGDRLMAVDSANNPADHTGARRILASGRSPELAEVAEPGFLLKR